MATVSSTIKMMDQFSQPLQRVTNQIVETTARMERMKRVVEAPTALNLDASSAVEQLNKIKAGIKAADKPSMMQILIDSDDVMRKIGEIKGKIKSVLSDSVMKVIFDPAEALSQIAPLKTKMENELQDIKAKIAVELPESLNSTFQGLQKLVTRLMRSIDTLDGMTQSSAAESEQLASALRRVSTLEQQITRQQSETNRQIKAGGSASRSWRDELQNVASAYYLIQGALRGLGSTTTVMDDYVNTQARLDLINDKLQTTAELQDKIFASADRARGSYADMAAVIGRMGTLAGDAFTSNDELIAFTELMQKSFRVGGSGTTEQQAGMYQLSQAMAAGKLQGDEFRSIMENAPMLAAAIADFTGKSKGELKEMSSEGTITADIIKGAMFNAANDINTKFATMPITFGDVMNDLKNTALQSFGSVIERINGMLNSAGGAAFIANLQQQIASLAVIAENLLTWLVNVYSFVAEYWPLMQPIVVALATAFVLWKGTTLAINTAIGIQSGLLIATTGLKAALTGVTLAQVDADVAATAAQWGLNAAILASPITWIILAIIALIAIIYIVVAAINKFAGTSLSATGIIAGAFLTAFAFIGNFVIGVLNAIIQYAWTHFAEPFLSIIEWILNACNGGFNSFGDAVANLIGQVISWFLSLGKVVTKIIDAIFGTDWTAGLSSLQEAVIGWGKNEEAITIERTAPEIDYRFDYSDAWDTGYDWGANLFGSDDNGAAEAVKNAEDLYTNLPTAALGAAEDNNIDKVGEVGKIKDTVDISSEDLKMMRELAEMKNIQNFVSLAPTVQVTTGPVNNGYDVDTIVSRIEEMLTEQVTSTAQGVYG